MTILDTLINKYGKHKVDSILTFIAMQDTIKESAFRQYISMANYNQHDISTYKLKTILKSNELYGYDPAITEIMNILCMHDSQIKRYNTIITYGTFDLFHIGHLNLLKRIKNMCNNLIVAVSTDTFNSLKGKKCTIPFMQRFEIVSACKYVDHTIPEDTWEQKPIDIKKYNVDAFVMGSDWIGKFDYLNDLCDVIYLDRTEGISSTMLKENISSNK